ncbi:DUF4253 domain-containing protein [bacterium]|nr:MAG: DUF4253 domain-containing protein [bacterium]
MDFRRLFRREPVPSPVSPLISPAPSAPDNEGTLSPWFTNSVGVVERQTVMAEMAFERWLALRAAVPQTGRWPLILGDARNVDAFEGLRERWDGDVASLVAVLPDAEARLAERYREGLMDGDEDTIEDDPDLDFDFDPTTLIVPDSPRQSFPHFLPGVDRVVIATLPTPDGTLAPAHLNYGSWNGYPEIAEHVAFLRHWETRHGAEVMGFGADTVELRPRAPILDPVEAKRLAREWFAYSYDNLFQGTESMPELAASLLGAEIWFSWWD